MYIFHDIHSDVVIFLSCFFVRSKYIDIVFKPYTSWMLHWHCVYPLQWRHNDRDGVSNHQPHDCWLNRPFRCRSKKTSKLRATGLCARNSPVTSEFPAQRTSNMVNVSIWWRHHANDWPNSGRVTLTYMNSILQHQNPTNPKRMRCIFWEVLYMRQCPCPW